VRILGLSKSLYLGDIYLSLQREGHEVRVALQEPSGLRAFGGLIEPVAGWRAELDWVGRDGIIMVEGVGQGALQDRLRADGYRVVGGSALGDRLERDREFGQAVMRDAGLPIAESHAFPDPASALDWLARHPRRTVLKWDGDANTTYVGQHPAGADVVFQLGRAKAGGVLLMEWLDGIEVGIGAYFDGRAFLRPACLDFEHKRFFPGDMGEMTGEMGTLASYEGSERLFEATLGRIAPVLARAGHVGYVNLNLIVDKRGAWPLEFTCRFGNPGFAVLAAMQRHGWGDLLRRMAEGGAGRFETLPGWSVCIVLTVPPFPSRQDEALPGDDPPVFFLDEPTGDEAAHYHLVDVRLENGRLLAHRRSGHIMIVTGTGPSVEAAQGAARARAMNVIAPELRWRGDIGDRYLGGEGDRLRALGWLADA
jgi:phosphoribosylamine---glycine ligase